MSWKGQWNRLTKLALHWEAEYVRESIYDPGTGEIVRFALIKPERGGVSGSSSRRDICENASSSSSSSSNDGVSAKFLSPTPTHPFSLPFSLEVLQICGCRGDMNDYHQLGID
ncbi:hypothetical protein EGR_10274 [Echinococcus granulosus]|uniref:Uncharacterized protein n=1 Tax=Echinococcus granulosus TaxID=6210 RepID=W6U2S3_ECHGR|nr:hypothetical protein EGR_10274 [Echinococcus granulosus]EUB54856.1 hypothetical protein EGR_10274 [Echinococcus granulosus]